MAARMRTSAPRSGTPTTTSTSSTALPSRSTGTRPSARRSAGLFCSRSRLPANKLFFFYSYENWDTLTPNPVRQVTTPTAAERNGDFSQSRDQNGNLIVVRDPITRQPFPDNKIPASLLNKNGQALLGVFPMPNQLDRSITGGNYNYQMQESIEVPRYQHLVRVDYRPSTQDAFYARYSRWFSDNKGYGVDSGSANWGLLKQHYRFLDNSAVGNYTRVLGSSMVNELAVGFRYSTEAGPQVDDAELQSRTRQAVGYTLGQFYPELNPSNLVPRTEFGTFIPNAAAITWAGRFPLTGRDVYFTINDSLSFTRGRHTFKAGFYMERVNNQEGRQANQFAGGFDFSRDTSNPLDSGHPYANALLGVFRSYTEQTSRPGGDGNAGTFEWFVQDAWKATPKLSVDLGIRFSTYTHFVQVEEASAFSLERFDPAKAPLLYAPALVNGVRVARNPLHWRDGLGSADRRPRARHRRHYQRDGAEDRSELSRWVHRESVGAVRTSSRHVVRPARRRQERTARELRRLSQPPRVGQRHVDHVATASRAVQPEHFLQHDGQPVPVGGRELPVECHRVHSRAKNPDDLQLQRRRSARDSLEHGARRGVRRIARTWPPPAAQHQYDPVRRALRPGKRRPDASRKSAAGQFLQAVSRLG